MKILLISANRHTVPYPVYPIGIDYVAGVLSGDHDVHVIDVNDYDDHDLMGNDIVEFGPEIIGISLRNIDNTDITHPTGFYHDYRALMEVVRRSSTAVVVLGGSGFTLFPGELMKLLQADFGVIGEGERFKDLVKAMENHQDPSNLPGIITGNRNEDVAVPRPYGGEFFREFKADRRHLDFYLKKGGMLNLQTKRGCCLSCVYCTYPVIEGKKMRLISPDRVAETALKLQDAGAKYLFITDSAFNSDYRHSVNVGEAFIRKNIKIPWGAFFVPSKPKDENYFEFLKEAGLTHVEFGTESLTDSVLKSYRKTFTVEDVKHAHNLALGADLHVAHYLLLGGPGEDESTVINSLENAAELEKTVLFFYFGMRIYPLTPLYKIALSQGQISETTDLLEPVFYRSPEVDNAKIVSLVESFGRERANWIRETEDASTQDILSRMYEKGYTGPLWEYLIR